MKRETRLVLAWLVVLFALSMKFAMHARCAGSSDPQSTNDAVESWVRNNYERVLDVIFQERCRPSKVTRWIVCVRIVPAHPDELEYSMSIEKRYGGAVFARVTRPRAKSVHTQLSVGKKEHPRASVSKLANLILVESQDGDKSRFPGVVGLADEFEKMRFSPALPDEIIMDPTAYRFRVRSSSGEHMEVLLLGPGPAAPGQPETLTGWAESLRSVLTGAFQ